MSGAAAPARAAPPDRPGATAARLLAVAWAAGAAGLALEVVAARVVALNVGVSLYSWTGVIGAVLAGTAAGAALGGRLADRHDEASLRRRLRAALAAAALLAPALVVALSALPVVVALEPLPRLGRLAGGMALLGFLPAVPLGMALPLAVRLDLREAARSGRVVGRLGAASTLGGLVGTLGAGLALVPGVGVRGTALLAGAVLLAAGAALGRRARWSAGAAAALAVVAAAAVAVPHACDRESAYQCIRVADEETVEGTAVKVLYLDGLPHTHVAPEDPTQIVGDYLLPAAEMAAYARPAGPLRVLIIGGGGYSLARYYLAAYPGAIVDVLELDPAVTETARARLGLTADPRLVVRHGDARQTIETLPPDRRYDLVALDAFADVVVPYHLATREFDARVAARLAPGGAYAALVHDREDAGRLLPAFARTIRSVFGTVSVLAPGPFVRWGSPVPRTWTVVGAAAPVDAARLARTLRPTARGGFPTTSAVMPPAQLAELLERPGPAVLTDDHAPVEVLAAPLFR